MTSFDRFEQQLPDLMADLATARVPDYFEAMLDETARARQRPRWSSLERWLPMDLVHRTSRTMPMPLRPVLLGAILILAAGAAMMAYVGSRPHVPAPFGPARNGVVVYGTDTGDIVSVDLGSGSTTGVLTGAAFDTSPRLAPDGRRLAFLRGPEGSAAWHVANIDGSDVVAVLPSGDPGDTLSWAPTSDRLVVTPLDGGVPAVVDLKDGTWHALAGDLQFLTAVWRPGTDELILTQDAGGDRSRFYLIDADGGNLKAIAASPYAVNSPGVSPDGSSIVYVSATTDGTAHLSATSLHASDGERPIHVFNLDTGLDRVLTTDASGHDGFLYLDPRFSPDGTRLLVDRYLGNGYRLAIVPLDGAGEITEIGPSQDAAADPRTAAFSPDGTEVLATFQFDGSTWLLPLSGEPGQRINEPASLLWSWQRKP